MPAAPGGGGEAKVRDNQDLERLSRRISELERRLEAQDAEQQSLRQRLVDSPAPTAAEPKALSLPAPREPAKGFELSLGGYGELQFAFHDYGPDQTLAGGSAPAQRSVFDATRLSLELEAEVPFFGIEIEAEVEFEHGGTGAALELEYEEFGEYEVEIERGGEVLLEVLYLEKKFGEHFSLRLGRFYVALGALSFFHRPTDYLGSRRPESETRVVPAVWDELGLEARYQRGFLRLTLQVVNGLDSTGFSSQRFVASGHQRRFELARATDLALVGRLDIDAFDGILVGVSTYVAPNTTGNRPKPDLKEVTAPLVLASGHLILDLKPVRARASLIWGHLWRAAEISDHNRRLSNNLDVLRTAVADEAISLWAEIGIDLFFFFDRFSAQHQLEAFVRLEHYDTMFKVSGETFDNPRFERTLIGGGVAYTFLGAIVAKLDGTHRRMGASDLRPENTLRLSVGFVF